jgi:hypothetical protein
MAQNLHIEYGGMELNKSHGILQPRSSLGTSVGELTWKWKLRQLPDNVGIVDGVRCRRALLGRWRWLDERHVRHVHLLLGAFDVWIRPKTRENKMEILS